MIFKELHCPIFNAYVLSYIGCPAEDLIEHLDEKYDIIIEEDFESCIGITLQANNEERTYYIIWVRNQNDITTTVHETLHLVYKILSDRGVLLGIDNQETVAYYLGYWFEKIHSKKGKI